MANIGKDWTGNARSTHAVLAARNYALSEREINDYYATEPKATRLLLDVEKLDENILEPACGEGHMSEVLKESGYNVTSYDKINRGYGVVQDFFKINRWDGDIVTNPPYKYAKEFVEHGLEIISEGHKLCLFLKLLFLESKSRRELFDRQPPNVVYVASGRLNCAKNGEFGKFSKATAVCYAWFVWEKGFKGEPVIRWIN